MVNLIGNPNPISYKINKNGCHIMTSHRRSLRGYGTIKRFRKSFLPHRLIFYIYNGYLPEVVMHNCDEPSCINPQHLIPGTFKLNSEDMVKKNRQAKGEKNSGGVKLNNTKAKEIKRLLKEGNLSLMEIAKLFKVSKRTILFIKQNQHWKHV